MNLIYFGNNKLGLRVLEHLKREGQTVTALVVHPPARAKYAREMKELSGLADDDVFLGDSLKDPTTAEKLAALQPTLGLSIAFSFILGKPIIDLFPRGIVNLHTSYLPYNRGMFPNVWSIVEGSPAGASLHFIDEGIDTGPLIARKKTPVDLWDTGETLYGKLEDTAYDLFVEQWEDIKNNRIETFEPQEIGTFHLKKDVAMIDELHLDKKYRFKDVLNILRARTFPPHESAYVVEKGKKIYIRVQLEPE